MDLEELLHADVCQTVRNAWVRVRLHEGNNAAPEPGPS